MPKLTFERKFKKNYDFFIRKRIKPFYRVNNLQFRYDSDIVKEKNKSFATHRTNFKSNVFFNKVSALNDFKSKQNLIDLKLNENKQKMDASNNIILV